MNPDTLYIIKVVCGVIAAVFTLSTAVFTFLDTAQNEQNEKIQAWFQGKWESVNHSRWLSLPENSTRWLLNTRVFLSDVLSKIYDSDVILFTLTGIVLALFHTACFMYWGSLIGYLSFGIYIFFGLLIWEDILGQVASLLLYLMLAIVGLTTTVLWLQLIVGQNLYYAAFIMIVFIPVFWIATLLPISAIDEFTISRGRSIEVAIAPLQVGIAGGFTITLLALLIGHLIEPAAYVPQTLQMLIANALFDGLTVSATFAILSRALSKDGLLRLPIAVLVDVLVAAVFAVCSLYFGVVFTDKAVSWGDTLHILFARSHDNARFELSPYFWVMHTTFVPTLLYLSLILFGWTAKALLIPVRWFFGLGQASKNPLKLTAGLCGIFAAIFGVLFFGTNSVYERAKETKPNQPAVIENSTNGSKITDN